MKPSDHPDFFRLPPPPGASRESTIRLDREGRFFHDGEPVENPKLAAALHSWIGRHPDDGKLILTNGYDWTYFEVEDAPFHVDAVRLGAATTAPTIHLSNGEEHPLGTVLREGDDGALYTTITRPDGAFEARFQRSAQASLAPLLEERDGVVGLRLGELFVVPEKRGERH